MSHLITYSTCKSTATVQDDISRIKFDDYINNLVWQLRFHFLFKSSEKERPENFVQTSDDQQSFFFVQLHLIKH